MKKTIYKIFTFGILAISALLAYCLYEPHTLEVTRYTLSAPELSGVKIVFAADFHVAPNDDKRIDNIISAINREQPDIVILGGDYVKGHKQSSSMPIDNITAKLSDIKSPAGIYAVLGNHDIWYGKNAVAAAFKKHNITILDNQNILLTVKKQHITLVGISDMATDKPDFIKAFQNAAAPAILISHSPDIFPQSPKTVLTLAAHTHGGQIRLPFIGAPVVNSAYGNRYMNGLIRENGKTMIVSKGLGTSILPVRFNCRPEIAVITFN